MKREREGVLQRETTENEDSEIEDSENETNKNEDARKDMRKSKSSPEKLFIRIVIVALLIIAVPIIWLGFYFLYLHIISPIATPLDLPKFDMNQYWGPYPMDPNQNKSTRRIKIEFSDVMINDLRERLMHQRPFQPPMENSGFAYGFNSNFLLKVLDFWKNKYDFKARERFFNKYNHYATNIQGLDIHYMHVRPEVPSGVKVMTLLLLHSWPGSVREFYEAIPILMAPNPKYNYFVFELIIPSLPGFGLSQAPARPGMDPAHVAIVMSKLMTRLGRSRYYVHGGDIGHAVGSALATMFPKNVMGFHTSTPTVYHPMLLIKAAWAWIWPSFLGDPEIPAETDAAISFLRALFDQTGHLHIQATKPDTIGIALTDSPAGLAAYIIEKYSLMNNPDYQKAEDGMIRNKFSLTQLLDNVMLYWISGSITTSMRFHAEQYTKKSLDLDRVQTIAPTWGLKCKHQLAMAPESVLLLKYRNYIYTTVADDGGLFAAMEHPETLVDDIFLAVDMFADYHGDKPNSNSKKNKQQSEQDVKEKPETVYPFEVTDINGFRVQLKDYQGYVLLIVNVASECGLTEKNYDQLVKLYDKYEDKGLRILAFPCNQFGQQEPGSLEDIKHFANKKGVRFDLFSKVDVNGDNAHALWNFLKSTQGGTFGDWIKWNFTKFLVDRDGVPVIRFGPDVNPSELEPHIKKYLNIKPHNQHDEF